VPNRRAHTKITLVSMMVTLPVAIYNPVYGLCFGLGILSTIPVKVAGSWIVLNPDMDIVANDSFVARSLGIQPYQRAISHRAGITRSSLKLLLRKPWLAMFYSHLPLVGTIPRTLIILSLATVFALMLGLSINPEWVLLFFLGMATSDFLHIMADIVVSGAKKTWNDL